MHTAQHIAEVLCLQADDVPSVRVLGYLGLEYYLTVRMKSRYVRSLLLRKKSSSKQTNISMKIDPSWWLKIVLPR